MQGAPWQAAQDGLAVGPRLGSLPSGLPAKVAGGVRLMPLPYSERAETVKYPLKMVVLKRSGIENMLACQIRDAQ